MIIKNSFKMSQSNDMDQFRADFMNFMKGKYTMKISEDNSSDEMQTTSLRYGGLIYEMRKPIIKDLLIDGAKLMYIKQWMSEDYAIMHRIFPSDSDPSSNLTYGVSFTHDTDEETVLDYIYVFKNYRRKGYALKLLDAIPEYHFQRIIAFTDSDESNKLFEKAKWEKGRTPFGTEQYISTKTPRKH